MKDYLKTKGVPNGPLPRSSRLKLNFSHVEMGLLTRQIVVVPITFARSQDEGIGDSDGLPCKYYTDTSTSSFLCFPHQHYW
jgi:hypothetical protein